jgi:hypothetical protein
LHGLPLDDQRWTTLHHAYGPASDTPQLLRQLALSPGPKQGDISEPWYSLWSSLCHQGDVYSASYAALPHIVQIALEENGPISFDFFLLPAAIEVQRFRKRGPEVPPFLHDAYVTGLAMLTDCVSAHRSEPWDQSMILSVAAAQAVSKGQHFVADALMNIDDAWISKINSDSPFR